MKEKVKDIKDSERSNTYLIGVSKEQKNRMRDR